MKNFLLILLVVVVVSIAALAQDPEAEIEREGQVDPGTYSCAEHIEIVDADDGRADVRIVWAHGYYSALRGFDTDSPPVTWKDVDGFARRLEQICRAKPNKLFLTAIREVKLGVVGAKD